LKKKFLAIQFVSANIHPAFSTQHILYFTPHISLQLPIFFRAKGSRYFYNFYSLPLNYTSKKWSNMGGGDDSNNGGLFNVAIATIFAP
jgi:hypothetical protein